MRLEDYVGKIPDFPKPGILFYDVSPLLANPKVWRATIRRLATAVDNYEPDMLCGIESRGFLLSAPLALELGVPFSMIQNPENFLVKQSAPIMSLNMAVIGLK
jgi:adenine phosphoribosyltransferase